MDDGLAPNLAALVEVLKKRPLEDVEQLEFRVHEHLADLLEVRRHGAPVELQRGRRTADLCMHMLRHWTRYTEEHRHLVQAAVLYFLETRDDEEDTAEGGFEDDLEVALWVSSRVSGG